MATFIKNKKSNSPYYGFYINPEGNHFRIFFNSQAEYEHLQRTLKEKRIPFLLDSGESFFSALHEKATTTHRQEELTRSYGMLKKTRCLKINGLNNLYAVALLLKHAEFSTKEFYAFLKLAVENQSYDPVEENQRTRQLLASGQFFAPEGPNGLFNFPVNDFRDFLMQGVESKELTPQDVHYLAVNTPHIKAVMESASPKREAYSDAAHMAFSETADFFLSGMKESLHEALASFPGAKK